VNSIDRLRVILVDQYFYIEIVTYVRQHAMATSVDFMLHVPLTVWLLLILSTDFDAVGGYWLGNFYPSSAKVTYLIKIPSKKNYGAETVE
jgi:hypothetical protein